MRTIVIGDVHGCLEELDELLLKVELRVGRDRLVLAGDLLDRGPDPLGVVRRARELGAEGVMGNHEHKHLRYRMHEALARAEPGYVNPMMQLFDPQRREHLSLGDDDWAYLERLPVWLRLAPDWVLVHAGFEPIRPLSQQHDNACLRVRYVDDRGRLAPLRRKGDKPAGSVRWATQWRGPDSVVYGHAVYDLRDPMDDAPSPGVRCLGIDTGCCFGGRLTALLLPSLETVQVQARATYRPFTPSDV
jgi:hypothetical protein